MNDDKPCACGNPNCPNNYTTMSRSAGSIVENAVNHIMAEMTKNNTTVHQIDGSISQGLKTKLEEKGFAVEVRLSSNDSVYTLVSTGPLVNYE